MLLGGSVADDNINAVAEAIGTMIRDVTGIAAVYTTPRWTLTRKLPAILVLYDGFSQTSMTFRTDRTVYTFKLTVYWALEGQGEKVDALWENIGSTAREIVTALRADQKLRGTALLSRVTRGRPIIHLPEFVQAKPRWIGHSFQVEAVLEED
jgi:hypothetical protein